MSREIMQQALDAFEDLKKSVTRDGTVSENWDAYYEKEYYALEALRQALAQPEQESEAYRYAKRLAEFIWAKHYKEESPDWTPLPDVLGVLTQIDNMTCGLELAKPEQEPVRWFQQFGDAPPRKPWVGLTDDDMHTIHDDAFVKNVDDIDWALQMARRIEAKLKELNT
jgi:hypothetical protein